MTLLNWKNLTNYNLISLYSVDLYFQAPHVQWNWILAILSPVEIEHVLFYLMKNWLKPTTVEDTDALVQMKKL